MVRRDFECTQCGNCCSDYCIHKKGNRCDVHPSIVGEEKAFWQRNLGCENTAGLVAGKMGFYCPPVIKAFGDETGILLHPRKHPDGYVTIEEWDDPTQCENIESLHRFVSIEAFWSKKNREVLRQLLED